MVRCDSVAAADLDNGAGGVRIGRKMAERADALATMAVCGVANRAIDLEGDSATQATAVAVVFCLRNWLASVISITMLVCR